MFKYNIYSVWYPESCYITASFKITIILMYIIFTDLYELWLIEILLRLRSRILGCVLRGALQLIRQMFSWLADHTHSCL